VLRISALLLLVLGLALVSGCASTTPGRTSRSEDLERREPEDGMASFYTVRSSGRRTASGERLDAKALTAAHRTLPFGTRVRVTNLENGRDIVVRINDRGPFRRGRVIDVSMAAARSLGFVQDGLARVRVQVVDR
jgi:rare lipoprotein A